MDDELRLQSKPGKGRWDNPKNTDGLDRTILHETSHLEGTKDTTRNSDGTFTSPDPWDDAELIGRLATSSFGKWRVFKTEKTRIEESVKAQECCCERPADEGKPSTGASSER